MLFGEIAYGPIHSRRLGVSLGMEIMPIEHKLCTFNCVYCECGWNEAVDHPQLPTRTEVREALEAKLKSLCSVSEPSGPIDVITFYRPSIRISSASSRTPVPCGTHTALPPK